MSAEVDLLREAATHMRKLAEAANTDDARRPYGNRSVDPVPESQWGALVDNYLGGDIGAHCASWTPAVALRVADWVEEAAIELERHIAAWTRPSQGVDDPPALGWNNPEKLAATIEHHFGLPLAVARAFLRREAVADA